MTVPGVPESVSEIRAAVCQLARSCGFPDEKIEAIRLAVSEAASNAVIHGYGEDAGQITVAAEFNDSGELRVVVADQGPGMLPQRDSNGLGLGVPLMTTLSDHVEITSPGDGAGTEVLLYFRAA